METNTLIATKPDIFISVITLVNFISVVFIHFVFEHIKKRFVLTQALIPTNEEFVNDITQRLDNIKYIFLLISFAFCIIVGGLFSRLVVN